MNKWGRSQYRGGFCLAGLISCQISGFIRFIGYRIFQKRLEDSGRFDIAKISKTLTFSRNIVHVYLPSTCVPPRYAYKEHR